ncbi:hypothetical protein VNO80_03001 [Phaseolus coccineus]|uniref:Uncharacterized protein n=1 Tax=Phaseolus coccineus TaxID=3886 RepID=A0AAN9NW06_PHACN
MTRLVRRVSLDHRYCEANITSATLQHILLLMMTMIKLFSLLILVILLSKGVSSTTEPTISASPGVLPYVSAPDISSFFPTPSGYQSVSYGASEAPAPAPSSGEFEGKKSSGSARLDCAGAIVGVLLCFAFISSMVIV